MMEQELPLALDAEARLALRRELDALPVEYQTRALEALLRIVRTYARQLGIDKPPASTLRLIQ